MKSEINLGDALGASSPRSLPLYLPGSLHATTIALSFQTELQDDLGVEGGGQCPPDAGRGAYAGGPVETSGTS